MCLEVVGNSYVYLYHCHGTGGNQSFVYTEDDRILSTSTNCMTADMESEFVYASFCAYESDGIKWQYNEKVSFRFFFFFLREAFNGIYEFYAFCREK